MSRAQRGFTLIELLIVVAIIAILAAIAVPNFLEAQVRSKISRSKSDLRTYAVALEAYAVDWNSYVISGKSTRSAVIDLFSLSTPVAYLSNAYIRDPFLAAKRIHYPSATTENDGYVYVYYRLSSTFKGAGGDSSVPMGAVLTQGDRWKYGSSEPYPDVNAAVVTTFGPNTNNSNILHALKYWVTDNDPATAVNTIYDSTNGTNSMGSVSHWVGDIRGFKAWK